MPRRRKQKDIEREMELGEKDEDIYKEAGRQKLEEDDEITELEQGFMKGYEEGAKMAKCAVCGKVLMGEVIEEDIDDHTYRFCSEICASKFKKK